MGAILIVDDDETNNFYAKHVLAKSNITENLYFAMNGQEALQIIADLTNKGITTDLILLDINMPIMNGFEFLEAYEKLPVSHRSKTVVTMMSSSVNSADMEKSKSYKSIDRRIEKPLTKEKIEAILSTL
ncbi:MAG: CheY-like chemotaxis protein [Crocinitomix sp.]|jgi:CheY-like chemotaxis protein